MLLVLLVLLVRKRLLSVATILQNGQAQPQVPLSHLTGTHGMATLNGKHLGHAEEDSGHCLPLHHKLRFLVWTGTGIHRKAILLAVATDWDAPE